MEGFWAENFEKFPKIFFRISKGSKRLHRALRSSGPAQLALFSIGNALVGRIGGRNGATPPYLLRICKIFEFLSQFFLFFSASGKKRSIFAQTFGYQLTPFIMGSALFGVMFLYAHTTPNVPWPDVSGLEGPIRDFGSRAQVHPAIFSGSCADAGRVA